jgi:hypothetical protein
LESDSHNTRNKTKQANALAKINFPRPDLRLITATSENTKKRIAGLPYTAGIPVKCGTAMDSPTASNMIHSSAVIVSFVAVLSVLYALSTVTRAAVRFLSFGVVSVHSYVVRATPAAA